MLALSLACAARGATFGDVESFPRIGVEEFEDESDCGINILDGFPCVVIWCVSRPTYQYLACLWIGVHYFVDQEDLFTSIVC